MNGQVAPTAGIGKFIPAMFFNSKSEKRRVVIQKKEKKSEIKFFENNLSKEIWEENYRFNGETVEGTCKRLVESIYKSESKQLKIQFYEALTNKRIVLGGRVTANTGTDVKNVNSFNCYSAQRSVKPYDSLKNIYSDLYNGANILKTEGGIGYDFSHLRPRGTFIKGIGVPTPGVIKFMELYDKSSEIITSSTPTEDIFQHEDEYHVKKKARKGAQISLLNINHPDIINYIEAKKIPNYLTKFNMTISITDEFMECVENDDDWEFWFPDINCQEYDTEWDGDFKKWKDKYPTKRTIYKVMNAKSIWELIIDNMYNRNEPGLFFIDNANKYNNLLYKQRIVALNPCGEITMLSDGGTETIGGKKYDHLGDICNLGYINLTQYHQDNDFDWKLMENDIKLLVRSLDNLIDISGYPFEKIKNAALLRRKIGCGFLGYGSLLMMKGLKYGSLEANKFTEELMELYVNTAYRVSADLAQEKGTFLLYDKNKIFENGYLKNGCLTDYTKKQIKTKGLRNSQLLTVSPTGNTGVYAGVVSGGLEPGINREFWRWLEVTHKMYSELKKMKYPDVTKGEWFETPDFKKEIYNDEEILVSKCGNYRFFKAGILRKKTLCEDYGWKWAKKNNKVKENDSVYATAMELNVDEHLKPFKIFSKYIDNSCSKTINLPNKYPKEEFSGMFIDAWRSGVRGFTTYREGTMTPILEQVKNKEIKKEQKNFYNTWNEHSNGNVVAENVSLPFEYPMKGWRIRSEGKKFYFNVAFKDKAQQRPFAIFVQTNAREPNVSTFGAIEAFEGLARERNISEKHIEDNAKKCKGQNNIDKIARSVGLLLRHNVKLCKIVQCLDQLEVPVGTFIFTLKKFLMKFIKNGTQFDEIKCPECGGKIHLSEGCFLCQDCGNSKC